MVVGVFPAMKLGVLFIKQISKPLTKVLIEQAKSHHLFRTYVIIPPAQLYHWAEIKAKMYLMNLGKPTKVSKLNEEMAIELGANLMGEVIIFGIAGGCLLLEYSRQQTKEANKERLRQEQLEKFVADIQGLHETVTQQEFDIKYLNTVIDELNKKLKLKLPPKVPPENGTSGTSPPTSEPQNPQNPQNPNPENSNPILKQALTLTDQAS